MPNPPRDDFVTTAQQLFQNRGKTANLADLQIAQNPEVAALASKMLRPKVGAELNFTGDNNNSNMGMVVPGTSQISKQIMGRVEDADNAFRLFPDLELAAQIVISSILSPKDMLKTDLNFRFEESQFSPAVSTRILDVIRTEITSIYKIEDRIYDMLRDALFRGGSHPVLVLPEAAIDQIINRSDVISTESIRESKLFSDSTMKTLAPMGILGDPRHVNTEITALESIFAPEPSQQYNEKLLVNMDTLKTDEVVEIKELAKLAAGFTSVTDNFQIFKLPELISTGIKQRVAAKAGNKLFRLALESASNKVSPTRLYDMLYKNAPGSYVPYTTIPSSANLKRRSVGRPLVMHLGPEAVIPVYVPGDYSNHIGYFIAIDADGHPVTVDSTIGEFGQSLSGMSTADKSGAGASPMLTERAKNNLISDNYTPIVDRMADIYAEILEKDLVGRLSSGVYRHNEISVSIGTEISRIMLARAWKGRYTRLVYVPGEYVTYFAFNFHRNGVGRSYLDDLSNVISMRAMVLFSTVWAKIRSSISVIKTNVTFDQRDTDPVKTIETVKHLIAKSRQQYFPNGLRTVQDFTDWIHKAGIMVTWDNHPRLPNTKIESESSNVEHQVPDDGLDELLRHMCYMHFGVAPETVDAGAKADFATTVQNNSILFSRRIAMLGNKTGVLLTGLVQKIAFNDEVIQKKIVDIFNDHSDEITKSFTDEEKQYYEENKARFTQALVVDTLNRVSVSLPVPEGTGTVNLKTELQNYEDLLDKVIASIISADALPAEIGGEVNSHIDALKTVWKSHLMRQYMADNNIAPEAFKIAMVDEAGAPMVNLNALIESHSSNIMLAVTDLLARMKPVIAAADKDLTKLEVQEGEPSSGDSTSSGEGGDDLGGENPFEIPGGDELPPDEVPEDDTGTGEQQPGPDQPPADEVPEETPPEA